jgi:hypothetical protein
MSDLTPRQKREAIAASKRVQSTPRGRLQGASTYRPSTNVVLNAKLTEDLEYGESATFKQWASPTPSDEDIDEEELPFEEAVCFSWSFLKSGEKLIEGSRVSLYWAGGRWYVNDSDNCPEDI